MVMRWAKRAVSRGDPEVKSAIGLCKSLVSEAIGAEQWGGVAFRDVANRDFNACDVVIYIHQGEGFPHQWYVYNDAGGGNQLRESFGGLLNGVLEKNKSAGLDVSHIGAVASQAGYCAAGAALAAEAKGESPALFFASNHPPAVGVFAVGAFVRLSEKAESDGLKALFGEGEKPDVVAHMDQRGAVMNTGGIAWFSPDGRADAAASAFGEIYGREESFFTESSTAEDVDRAIAKAVSGVAFPSGSDSKPCLVMVTSDSADAISRIKRAVGAGGGGLPENPLPSVRGEVHPPWAAGAAKREVAIKTAAMSAMRDVANYPSRRRRP